jgi:hypothetical protein
MDVVTDSSRNAKTGTCMRLAGWAGASRIGMMARADGCRPIEEQGMKRFLVLGWCLMAAVAAIPAAAAPYNSGAYFRPYMQDQRSRPGTQREADRRGPQREADRSAPQRELRAPGDADRGRMSPDERRQLRRDIQDAGRDIYQRDRQAPRRQQRR